MLHNHFSERCDLVACGVHRRLLYFYRACLLGWHSPSRPVVGAFAGPLLRGCARSPPTTLHNIKAERSTVCVRRCRPVLCPCALLLCAPRSAIATKKNSKFVGVIRDFESFVIILKFSLYASTYNRPTQSIMYIPLQVNRFQKSILLIVQYNI